MAGNQTCNPCWNTIITIQALVSSSSQNIIPSQTGPGSSANPASSAGSSAPASGGIGLAPLGTNSNTLSTSISLTGITCNAGDVLLVAVGIVNSGGSIGGGCTYNGNSMNASGTGNGACPTTAERMFYLKITSPISGGMITFTGNDATASDYLGLVILASKITGLTNGTINLLNKDATGTTSTTPTSGSGTTSTAKEFWWGVIAQTKATAITLGTWSNGFTDDQSVNVATSGGGFLSIDSGYKIVNAIGTAQAAKTGTSQSCYCIGLNTFS